MYKIVKEFVEHIVLYIITGNYKLNNTLYLNEELKVFQFKDYLYKYIMNITMLLMLKHNLLKSVSKYNIEKDFTYLSNAFPIIKFMDLDSQIDLDREYKSLSMEFGKECSILPRKFYKKIKKKCSYINKKNMTAIIIDYLLCKNVKVNKKDAKLLASIFLCLPD
jgi:hypothetical protein